MENKTNSEFKGDFFPIDDMYDPEIDNITVDVFEVEGSSEIYLSKKTKKIVLEKKTVRQCKLVMKELLL